MMRCFATGPKFLYLQLGPQLMHVDSHASSVSTILGSCFPPSPHPAHPSMSIRYRMSISAPSPGHHSSPHHLLYNTVIKCPLPAIALLEAPFSASPTSSTPSLRRPRPSLALASSPAHPSPTLTVSHSLVCSLVVTLAVRQALWVPAHWPNLALPVRLLWSD